MSASVVALLPFHSLAQGDANAPEMTQQDEDTTTFRSKVNLVLVPVVVRNREGQAVGNLEQKDFALVDQGKPQVITRFSVEKSAINAGAGKTGALNTEPAAGPADPAGEKSAAQRFVVYLFDDLHLEPGDLAYVQKAAVKHIAGALDGGTRAAIYTTSGRRNLDFTDQLSQLQDAITKVRIAQLYRSSNLAACPQLTYYMADQILNKNDQTLLNAKIEETVLCAGLQKVPNANQLAQTIVQNQAAQLLPAGEQDTRVTLSVVSDVIRRLQVMPGTRLVVLVSPGFVTPAIEDFERKTEIFDKAAHAGVTISSIDARGLYTTNVDASQQSVNSHVDAINQQYLEQSAHAQEDVLAELAQGTGGLFFHDNNDLLAGFERVARPPEYRYLLGFAPSHVKPDGSFHHLKVSLVTAKGFDVQARRGYYAPKHNESEQESAKSEIEQAVFSRDEVHALPVELHTQFFKPGPADARLTVLARIDLKRIRFRKTEGRNRNELTVVSVLFDNNGNYVAGLSKTLQMRFRDETLAKLDRPITLTANFNVKPGAYLVRLVVRDAQQQVMSEENGSVDIP